MELEIVRAWVTNRITALREEDGDRGNMTSETVIWIAVIVLLRPPVTGPAQSLLLISPEGSRSTPTASPSKEMSTWPGTGWTTQPT